jgi:hypothetical protein
MDNGIQTDAVFLNLTKAFDSIPQKLLLAKLHHNGYNGKNQQ